MDVLGVKVRERLAFNVDIERDDFAGILLLMLRMLPCGLCEWFEFPFDEVKCVTPILCRVKLSLSNNLFDIILID